MYQGNDSYIQLNTALNQQRGSTQQQGMKQVGSNFKQKLQNIKKDRMASAASIHSASPKTPSDILNKMQANGFSPALPDIVISASPVVVREIKKGADPVQAYRALKTEPAIMLTECKKMYSQAMEYYETFPLFSESLRRGTIAKALSNISLQEQQILALAKEGRILSIAGSSDAYLHATSSLAKKQMDQSIAIAEVSEKIAAIGMKLGIHHDLYDCAVGMARAEGALAFEARIGSEIRTPEAELADEINKTSEEIVEETEGAVILAQAAEEDADLVDPAFAQTPSDKALADKSRSMDSLLTPTNLIIGGLALGTLYLVFVRD